MPVDKDGNRADMVMDPGANLNRMNLGRLYETYIGAASRDITKEVRRILGVTEEKIPEVAIHDYPAGIIHEAYNFLLGYYNITSSRQYAFYKDSITEEQKLEHLVSVVNNGIYLYMPIENDKDNVEIVKAIEKYHKPTYGPVSYVGDSGQRCVTKDNVRIAPLYIMLLEKIADDWSSVSSGKLQHFGILAPMTKSEKFAHPFRNTPVRTVGETEARIFASYCGRETAAEMIDMSNNPLAQRNAYWNIMNADKPTNIARVINRDYIKLGSSKPLSLVKHIMGTSGVLPIYHPEQAKPIQPIELASAVEVLKNRVVK